MVKEVKVLPTSQQYSDLVKFTARIYNGASLLGSNPSASVTFKISDINVDGAVNVSLIAEAATTNLIAEITKPLVEVPASPSNAQMAPGAKTVKAIYNSITSPSSNCTPTASLTITQEDADVTYTGLPYFSTGSSTSCVAVVTLSATIKDITALGGADVNAGDIRNARVTFHLGSVAGPVVGTPNIPVVLVSPGNTMIGTASTTFNYTLSSSDCANKGTTLDVYAVVDNYYTGDNDLDPGNVTISVPGSESVTGGGYLVMQSSVGVLAGTIGKKTNFGFTMKWNNSGTNVKGQCNIIIRKDGRIYQVKSNAINSLSVNGSNGNFATKANIRDITDPLNPITSGPGLGGNKDLFVNMYDGSPGGQLDSISILVMDGSTILYSSHWNGTQTVRRLLDGGNVQVRQSTPATNTTITRAVEVDRPADVLPFNVKVFPNPSQDQFSLYLEGANNDKVHIVVYDALGREVKKFEKEGGNIPVIFGRDLKGGAYFVEVRQGENHKTIKLIKQN